MRSPARAGATGPRAGRSESQTSASSSRKPPARLRRRQADPQPPRRRAAPARARSAPAWASSRTGRGRRPPAAARRTPAAASAGRARGRRPGAASRGSALARTACPAAQPDVAGSSRRSRRSSIAAWRRKLGGAVGRTHATVRGRQVRRYGAWCAPRARRVSRSPYVASTRTRSTSAPSAPPAGSGTPARWRRVRPRAQHLGAQRRRPRRRRGQVVGADRERVGVRRRPGTARRTSARPAEGHQQPAVDRVADQPSRAQLRGAGPGLAPAATARGRGRARSSAAAASAWLGSAVTAASGGVVRRVRGEERGHSLAVRRRGPSTRPRLRGPVGGACHGVRHADPSRCPHRPRPRRRRRRRARAAGVRGGGTAALSTERDLLRERVVDLEATVSEDAQTASVLAPLRDALGRVERQVVDAGARPRRSSTPSSASASPTSPPPRTRCAPRPPRWRAPSTPRPCAAPGARCSCAGCWSTRACWPAATSTSRSRRVSRHDRGGPPGRRRPAARRQVPRRRRQGPDDGVPAAQADGVGDGRARPAALRRTPRRCARHVDALAAKAYWSAFTTTPEMVVCFVPGEAILAAALSADPGLYDHAMSRKVVLASPGTLLALLRTVAFTWQQDALTSNARELLELGQRRCTRGSPRSAATSRRWARSLQKSVESYNALVGALESRVLVTARRMHDLRAGRERHPRGPADRAGAPTADRGRAAGRTEPTRAAAAAARGRAGLDWRRESPGTGASRHRPDGRPAPSGAAPSAAGRSVQRAGVLERGVVAHLVASTPLRALRSRRSSLGSENSRISSAATTGCDVRVAALGEVRQHVPDEHLRHAGAARSRRRSCTPSSQDSSISSA